jgi:hypothetical protein
MPGFTSAAQLLGEILAYVGAPAGGEPVPVPPQGEMAATIANLQVHPNPFNPATTISFRLGQPGRCTVRIYDLLGKLVRTIHAGQLEAGVQQFRWTGNDEAGARVASGVYFLRVVGNQTVVNRKLMLLK